MWLWQNVRDKDIAVQTDSLVQPRNAMARVVDYPHGVGKFHSGSNFRKVRIYAKKIFFVLASKNCWPLSSRQTAVDQQHHGQVTVWHVISISCKTIGSCLLIAYLFTLKSLASGKIFWIWLDNDANKLSKVFWSFILFFGLGLTTDNILKCWGKYKSYPTITKPIYSRLALTTVVLTNLKCRYQATIAWSIS